MSAREPATVATVVDEARRRLRAAGIETADLDARLLVGDALGLDAAGLVLRAGAAVGAPARGRIENRVARRTRREPVHRILGRRTFYAHDFELSPATLEPRPDTEILVDLCRAPVAAHIARRGACVFADVGTGTGAIAVSLLALFPQARAVAIDISAEALRTAAGNAARAGVGDRFSARLGDHLAALDRPIDMVVSNPPYIPSGAIAALPVEVRDHDPRLALDGGADGLDSYRAIAREAAQRLSGGGEVAVEIGAGQGNDVEAIFAAEGFALADAANDLSGIRRALLFCAS